MSTSPAREFHGRDAELAQIRAELERLSDGAEAVVVVEGAAGMGKSRLLTEVAAIARSLGVRVGRSAADQGETVVELAALLATLFDGAEPLLDPGELTTLRAQPEQRFWLLRDLQQLLERAALDSPLLISIDDAQWVDGGTVAAIRTLPMRLMGLPIAWVIALRPPREATPLVYALEQLKQDGARTIVLGPLDDDAVVQLATDMLAAQPDQSILKPERSWPRPVSGVVVVIPIVASLESCFGARGWSDSGSWRPAELGTPGRSSVRRKALPPRDGHRS